MKTIGIIMECNPFHKGHEYILTAAKEQFGADHIIVILSGDHVQRGEPAIMDKYARTDCILHAGADLVLELPVPYATGSAQYFARGAVSALLHTGVTDCMLFGSESGDVNILKNHIPNIPAEQEDDALSVPAGRFTAFSDRILPNDLLATEYLKALQYFGSGIAPLSVSRIGAAYHDLIPVDGYASAGALRTVLYGCPEDASLPSAVTEHIPDYGALVLEQYRQTHRFLSLSDYSDLIAYALLSGKIQGYTEYFDIFDDLSCKITANLEAYTDAAAFVQHLKSKDIAFSHLSRALLHILLQIRTEDVCLASDKYAYCPYLRPLGLRKDSAKDLMHAIKANADRPLLSKLADARTLLDSEAYRLLQKDMFASELYARKAEKNGSIVSEYRRSLILL